MPISDKRSQYKYQVLTLQLCRLPSKLREHEREDIDTVAARIGILRQTPRDATLRRE